MCGARLMGWQTGRIIINKRQAGWRVRSQAGRLKELSKASMEAE